MLLADKFSVTAGYMGTFIGYEVISPWAISTILRLICLVLAHFRMRVSKQVMLFPTK